MSAYEDLQTRLCATPERWLVTGCAGFIGSHLVERLIELDQEVVGLDNFLTGHRKNIDAASARAKNGQFTFIEGDITDLATCQRAADGVQRVLHQAALGSVPRSLDDPINTHRQNVDGFLNMLVAARDGGATRFVYASSSSVYGDEPNLPKVEAKTGNVLSPYAATKAVNELYANMFQGCYGLGCVGLRYFNVFGARQDPNGPYAAVIPRWVDSLLDGGTCEIFGDGETSRDFCYVDNAVQANLLAAFAEDNATGRAFNVAFGERTTLNELYGMIRERLTDVPDTREPKYKEFRKGDVRHSLADISSARELLGYQPHFDVHQGMDIAVDWYVSQR